MNGMKASVLTLAGIMFLTGASLEAKGQLEKKGLPPLKKAPHVVVAPDLGITDLFHDEAEKTVYVQVGNFGKGNAGRFIVRLSMKAPGATTKTYIEKTIDSLKASIDVLLTFRIESEIKDLEFGVFVDAKKEVTESNEKNCGKLYPGGGTAGLLPCEGF